MPRLLLVAVLMCAQIVAHAAELVVQLPERDALVFQVPAGWSSEVTRPRPDMPPLVTLSSAQPLGFQVLVTPIWPMGSASKPNREDIHRLVEGAARQVANQAVEQQLLLQELGGLGKFGYYFSATDRNPKPTEYTFLTQGAMGFGELRVTFTVLANGKPEPVVSQALEMLRTLQRSRGKPGAV